MILIIFASFLLALMEKNFQKFLLPLFTDIFFVTVKNLAALIYMM